MKRVMIFLEDEIGDKLVALAKQERRSAKASAEKIVIDYLKAEEFVLKENGERTRSEINW